MRIQFSPPHIAAAVRAVGANAENIKAIDSNDGWRFIELLRFYFIDNVFSSSD
jgi:hypothetical protein